MSVFGKPVFLQNQYLKNYKNTGLKKNQKPFLHNLRQNEETKIMFNYTTKILS